MANVMLRDRDAIVTHEGLIFRVLGYTHPPDAHICDLEYAPSTLYQSSNPKAYRSDGKNVFYKFYGDEGWSFLEERYPQYLIDYRLAGRKVIGVRREAIAEVRRPWDGLQRILGLGKPDEITRALKAILMLLVEHYGLLLDAFGVFGSLLHGFYDPRFSDLDMVIYGGDRLERLRTILSELYGRGSPLINEYLDDSPIRGKTWRFKNISPKEFVWHQRRKLIYAVYRDLSSGRRIKVEFEPVKEWHEIKNEYDDILSVRKLGWIKAVLRVTDDRDGPFMPSIYYAEPVNVIEGPKCDNLVRIVSYIEEFRMQCFRDEIVYAEGNLEEVETRNDRFHQVTLTYGERYYEQTLKVLKPV